MATLSQVERLVSFDLRIPKTCFIAHPTILKIDASLTPSDAGIARLVTVYPLLQVLSFDNVNLSPWRSAIIVQRFLQLHTIDCCNDENYILLAKYHPPLIDITTL